MIRIVEPCRHADRSSRPHRSPQQTAVAKVERILAARHELRRGPDRLGSLLGPPLGHPVSTVAGIAASHGLTLKALLAFPENARYRANPGLIQPGDIVRVK